MSGLVLLALRGIDEETAPLELKSRGECAEVLGKLKALVRTVEDRKLELDAETGSVGDAVITRWIRQEMSEIAGGFQGVSCRKGLFEVGPSRAEVTLRLTQESSDMNDLGVKLEMLAAAGSKQEMLWSVSMYSSDSEGDLRETKLQVKRATKLLEASGVKEWFVEPESESEFEEEGSEEEEEEEEDSEEGDRGEQEEEGGGEEEEAGSSGNGDAGDTKPGEEGVEEREEEDEEDEEEEESREEGPTERARKRFLWPVPPPSPPPPPPPAAAAHAAAAAAGQRPPTEEQTVRSFVSELTRVMLGRLAAPHREEAERSGAEVEPGEGLVKRCLGQDFMLSTDAAALGRWLRGEDDGWRLDWMC